MSTGYYLHRVHPCGFEILNVRCLRGGKDIFVLRLLLREGDRSLVGVVGLVGVHAHAGDSKGLYISPRQGDASARSGEGAGSNRPQGRYSAHFGRKD